MSTQSSPEPVDWDDPESLPERVLRAFERHPNWIPTKHQWGETVAGRLHCCGLTALIEESPDFDRQDGCFYVDDRIGLLCRKAFTTGFDTALEELPRYTESQKAYAQAGKRAWELVKPLAEQRRKEAGK